MAVNFLLNLKAPKFYQASDSGAGGQKEDNFEERNKPNCCGLAIWLILLVIRLEPDNIVVTKSFSEYCNAALSVVHELHTAPFQCSSPLLPLGMTKIIIILEFREYMVIEWKRLSIF